MDAERMDGAIEQLRNRLGCEWPALRRAQQEARATQARLRTLAADLGSPDAAMVVYGSLAREEWTRKSDIDWTLLVDGRADPTHLRAAREISAFLAQGGFAPPGPTGVFGNMTFSHDLYNKIGGIEDSNENTTRRILLLLESRAMTRADAYDRLLRLVVERYLEDDRGLTHSRKSQKVPFYLLNDIVRYWRTIAVDFVDKQRGRRGKGWALRYAKLRLSRKLIFVAGMLTCFSCELFSPAAAREALSGEQRSIGPMAEHLLGFIRRTPLDVLAHTLLCSTVKPETARALLDTYEAFLSVLDDEDRRRHLQELTEETLSGDEVFIAVSRLGRRFQDALVQMFFKEDERLSELTMAYGIF